MSQMQLGLLAMGAVVILAVALYNQWTTRRNAPRRSSLKPDLADAPSAVAGTEGAGPLDERLEPVLGPGVHSGEGIGLPPAAEAATHGIAVRLGLLDPLIDAVATLTLEGVVSGDAVLAAMPATRRVGTKLFSVEGLHAGTGIWEPPQPGQRYSAVQVGVQLANRVGPLNEIEFSDFVMKVQAFADELQALVDFPDMMQEVARARELDQFASAHDAQLGFTVRARRASWSPGYLTQQAALLGFVAGVLPGRMVLPSSQLGAAPLLVLQYETQAALAEDPEQSALRECQLSLDVPHVPRAEQPFARLCEVAASLAQGLEGVVTDGSEQVLSPAFIDTVAADLAKLYDALAERELDAGSPLARRLFS